MPSTSRTLLVAVAVAAAAACSSNDLAVNPCPVGASPGTCGGFIGSGEQISVVLTTNPYSSPAIGLPATVHAGVPFTVTFYTLFQGCVTPAGEDLVSGNGLATIIPKETARRASGEMCPDYMAVGPRSATIALFHPGNTTVRVVGRIEDLGSLAMDTVSANVVVLP